MAGVITEIAIECGVSEQAVRAWCRRNHVAKDAKGSFAISESQKTAIYQHYLGVERKQVSQPAKASCETCETTLIAMLQGELDRKSEQLAVKDKQIEELNARLAEVSSALVTAQQTAAAPRLSMLGRCISSFFPARPEPISRSVRQNRFKSVAGLVSSLGTKQNDKSEFVLSIITAVISLLPLVYGLSYFTFVGALITMALVTECILIKMQQKMDWFGMNR